MANPGAAKAASAMRTGDIDIVGRKGAVRFAVATLEDWQTLCAVLDDLSAEGVEAEASIVLTAEACARARADATERIRALLDRTIELHFPADPSAHCSAGKLADALSSRQAEGARSLAEALTPWLTRNQAAELQGQIARGRLALWLELSQPEHHGTVCGRLVRASIDIVELCSIDLPDNGSKHPADRERHRRRRHHEKAKEA